MKKLIMSILGIFIGACSNKVDTYIKNEPKLDIEQFLSGKISGYGIVEDYKHRVTKRFDFYGNGHWNNNSGSFDEKITYSDGQVDTRVWNIKKISQGLYEATTADVIGKATIKVAGNAMNWRYTMNIKVNKSIYKIDFDDWMYQMPNGQIINRNYFKKFGLNVGELTLFMQKESSV